MSKKKVKKQLEKRVIKSKDKTLVPPGFFIYQSILLRCADFNPEILPQYIDEEFKNKLKNIIATHKGFCDKYCDKTFWKAFPKEGDCYLRKVKKTLNKLNKSKSSKGKFKCSFYDEIC